MDMFNSYLKIWVNHKWSGVQTSPQKVSNLEFALLLVYEFWSIEMVIFTIISRWLKWRIYIWRVFSNTKIFNFRFSWSILRDKRKIHNYTNFAVYSKKTSTDHVITQMKPWFPFSFTTHYIIGVFFLKENHS